MTAVYCNTAKQKSRATKANPSSLQLQTFCMQFADEVATAMYIYILSTETCAVLTEVDHVVFFPFRLWQHFKFATTENYSILFFFLIGWDWVHMVLRPLFGLLYQPQMIDDERGAIGGMWIGRGNRSSRIKPASIQFCPPQIPHDLTRARTRATTVGSRRLTPEQWHGHCNTAFFSFRRAEPRSDWSMYPSSCVL
jgi:hypothetical protein